MQIWNPRAASFCALLTLLFLTTAARATSITLEFAPPNGVEPWTNVDGSIADDLAGFDAECNGIVTTFPTPDARTLTLDVPVPDNGDVSCVVRAFDADGNRSANSNVASTTVQIEPGAPQNVTIIIKIEVN